MPVEAIVAVEAKWRSNERDGFSLYWLDQPGCNFANFVACIKEVAKPMRAENSDNDLIEVIEHYGKKYGKLQKEKAQNLKLQECAFILFGGIQALNESNTMPRNDAYNYIRFIPRSAVN